LLSICEVEARHQNSLGRSSARRTAMHPLPVTLVLICSALASAASITKCKSAGGTNWSPGNECSMQLDFVQPVTTITSNTSTIAWSIRSLYGDPITLGSASVAVCDSTKTQCIPGSSDFVSVPSTTESINSTFARGKASVTFTASDAYTIAVFATAGSNGQQFTTSMEVSVVVPSTSPISTSPPSSTNASTMALPNMTAPLLNATTIPTNTNTTTNRTNATMPNITSSSTPSPTSSSSLAVNSSVFMIVGIVIAVVFAAFLAVLFSKLRKAKANISSQSSAMSNESTERSRVAVEMAPKITAP
ncbi:hypothetical protein As57867_006352, partial [Aphanomyces stellatus]